MAAVDYYIDLVDEATTLYNSFQVINFHIQGIDYIKDLQTRVQSFPLQNIETELISDTPDATTLQRRLDFLEMKLKNKLVEFEEGDKGDFLNDNGIREQSFIEKMGRETCIEYTIRLASIFEWLNCYSLKIIKLIEELRNLDMPNYQQDNQQRQATSKPPRGTTDEVNLPSELDTKQAKALLQKAIQGNLCDNNYKWLKTKALLAYFADKASEYLGLGKGVYDRKEKTSWKPFETLFGVSGLSGAKRDYQKTGIFPVGHKNVDDLFE